MCGETGLTIYTALVKANQTVVLSIAEHALSKGGGFGSMPSRKIFKITCSEIESEAILKNI